MIVGRVISGKFGELCIRQHSQAMFELGTLLVAEHPAGKMLIQVYDLAYGSQLSQQNLELASGLDLEEGADLTFFDPQLRNYTLAYAKNLIDLTAGTRNSSKSLPPFFSTVRQVTAEDLQFLNAAQEGLYLGQIRSGSEVLPVSFSLSLRDVIRHHILIPATTGKGKSNLLSVFLWTCAGRGSCGILVFDPHDEYYGRTGLGLKDHPSKSVVYYTPREPPPGGISLRINLHQLKPYHFSGAISWSDAQSDAVLYYYKRYGDEWITALLLEREVDIDFNEATLSVVRRKLSTLLDIRVRDGTLFCSGIFQTVQGDTTLEDIGLHLEQGKIVVIDTSSFAGAVEILLSSLFAGYVFNRYKHYNAMGKLATKPVIGIVLEEAPRVLGKEVLAAGPNIFSTIAREGRKFNIGLIAITQLPSLIPRDILANMNTKIILGLETAPERNSIIESASHDLSSDMRSIASLDRGEAIVSSPFTPFAVPVKIPLLSEYVRDTLLSTDAKVRKAFPGMELSEV